MNDLQKRTWAEISLENLRHNYKAIRKSLPAGCRFLGVVKALREGHMDSCWTEGDSTVLRLIAEDTLTADVWMDGESMIPRRAELISDGQVRVFCTISNWN